jgi:hypothetical protein
MGSITMKVYIYSKQLDQTLPLIKAGVEMIFDDQESAMATAVKVAGEWNNVNYLEVHDWEPKCE